MKNIAAIAATVAFLCVAAANAQAPMKAGLTPLPPGTVVENEGVAFNGESPSNQWRAVVSKRHVGSGNGQDFYQWYLSIYALKSGAYRLRYQTPRNGGPLSRVSEASGVKMWYPVQDLRIVGAANLMGPGVHQLVVQSHEMAADCGSATVTVFASKPGNTAGPIVTVTNPCQLSAKIGVDGTTVVLTGPYYKSNAPMCCPTKSQATATLRYSNGKWSETPNYFKTQS